MSEKTLYISSVVGSIHLSAVVTGILSVMLVAIGYGMGAYYHSVEWKDILAKHYNYDNLELKNVDRIKTFQDLCVAFQRVYYRSDSVNERAKPANCPNPSLAIFGVVFTAIVIAVSFWLLIRMLRAKDNDPPIKCLMWNNNVHTFTLRVCGILLLIAASALVYFLASISSSNFPHCVKATTGKGKGRSASLAGPTAEEFQTCDAFTNYIYKHKLIIAGMVFGIFAGVLHLVAGFVQKPDAVGVNNGMPVGVAESGTGINSQFQTGGQMMTPSQYQQPQFQIGGQMMTPSQYQQPQFQIGGQVMAPSQYQHLQAQYGRQMMMMPSQNYNPQPQ